MPDVGVYNDGWDNEEHHYICHVGGLISPGDAERGYTIIGNLGKGAFGQVLHCSGPGHRGGPVALKVVKHRDFCGNAGVEVKAEAEFLEELRGHPNIVELAGAFEYRGHPCLALEKLGPDLLQVLKERGRPGLPVRFVRAAGRQLALALGRLREAGLVHGDLKPENALLASEALERPCWPGSPGRAEPRVKLIDFGTAQRCKEGADGPAVPRSDEITIQTLPYRAPEVFLGLPFAYPADMWSLGCICGELFAGEPVFPHCVSEQHVVQRIVALRGQLPAHMLQAAPYVEEFFHRRNLPPPGPPWRQGRLACWLESLLMRARAPVPRVSARSVFAFELRDPGSSGVDTGTLSQHVAAANYEIARRAVLGAPRRLRPHELARQHAQRGRLLDFMLLALRTDPKRRLTPAEAAGHAFFTGE